MTSTNPLEEHFREANVPTQQPQARSPPRLSREEGYEEWPAGAEKAPSQGAQAPVRLMERREGRRDRWRSLRDRAEFERVYREGAKYLGRLLVLYLLPAADCARGVVASRKIGGAVQRNRAKRLLRAALNAERLSRVAAAVARTSKFPAQKGDARSEAPSGGLWVVAVARSGILSAKSSDVAAEIEGFVGED